MADTAASADVGEASASVAAPGGAAQPVPANDVRTANRQVKRMRKTAEKIERTARENAVAALRDAYVRGLEATTTGGASLKLCAAHRSQRVATADDKTRLVERGECAICGAPCAIGELFAFMCNTKAHPASLMNAIQVIDSMNLVKYHGTWNKDQLMFAFGCALSNTTFETASESSGSESEA